MAFRDNSMRTLLLILSLVMAGAVANAAPADCLAVLGGTNGQLSALLATNQVGGCYHQDKIFYDFVYRGPGAEQHTAAEVNVSHVFQVIPDQALHGWLIAPVAGLWTAPFDWGFKARVCSPPADNCGGADVSTNVMYLFKQQINTGVVPNGSAFNGTVTGLQPYPSTTPNGSVIPVNTSGSAVPPGSLETVQVGIGTQLHIDFLGSFNGVGNLASVEDDVVQTGVPEPASMALLGSGLLVLGIVRRRIRK